LYAKPAAGDPYGARLLHFGTTTRGEGNEYHESRRLFSARKPDVLHYRDVPLPVCGPDDVLVKIEAIALEGGDVINRVTAVPGSEGRFPVIRRRAASLPLA
jgi:hypothetical protein